MSTPPNKEVSWAKKKGLLGSRQACFSLKALQYVPIESDHGSRSQVWCMETGNCDLVINDHAGSIHCMQQLGFFTWVKGKMVRGGSRKRAESMKALDGFEMKRITLLSEKRTIRMRSKQTLKPVYLVGPTAVQWDGWWIDFNQVRPLKSFFDDFMAPEV